MTKKGHVYSAQSQIKHKILSDFRANPEYALLKPIQRPIHLEMTFYMPIPASVSKKAREALKGTPHSCKSDLDNIIKFYFDVFNGILWEDDALIYSITAIKVYGGDPITVINIF